MSSVTPKITPVPSTLIMCTGSETVLLTQDVIPWYEDANVQELTAQGINFCIINSDEIDTTDLTRFKLILISSDQTQKFYDNLFPGGVVHPAITAFTEQGGILSANLTDVGIYDRF